MNPIYKYISHISTVRPFLTIFICLLPTLISLVVVFVTPPYSLYLSPTFVHDYFVWDDPLLEMYDMRRSLRENFKIPYSSILGLNFTRANPHTDFSIILMFHAAYPNPHTQTLFTPRRLAAMKRAEDAIFKSNDFQSFCFSNMFSCPASDKSGNGIQASCNPPHSILNHPLLYGYKNSSTTTSIGVCERKQTTAELSAQQVNTAYEVFRSERLQSVSTSFDKYIAWDDDIMPNAINETEFNEQGSGVPWLAYSNIIVAMPFANYSNENENYHTQEMLWWDWVHVAVANAEKAAGPDLKMHVIGVNWAFNLFGKAAFKDMKFVLLSLAILLFFLYMHSKSVFLALFAMGQVICAFPVAYCIYSRFLRIPYFAILHCFVVFLVLGISADDVFVLTDSWIMSEDDSWLESIHSIALTSFTTALAFATVGFASIMPMSTAGIWSSILMTIQFLLVAVAYPCALTIWVRYICRKRHNRTSALITHAEYRQAWFENLVGKLWDLYITTIMRGRILISFIAFVFTGTFVYFSFQIKMADRPEALFPSSHPITVAMDTYRTHFGTLQSEEDIEVSLTWGLSSIERNSTLYYNRHMAGQMRLNEKFDLSDPITRQYLSSVCYDACSDPELVDQSSPCRCWVNEFENWTAIWFPNDNHNKSGIQFVHDVLQFTIHSRIVEEGETGATKRPYLPYLLRQEIIPSDDLTRIVATELRFQSSVKASQTHSDLAKSVERWKSFARRLDATAPASVGNVTMSDGLTWLFLRTKDELKTSLLRGTASSLCVAFVILTLGTGSLIIGTVATLAISGIICGVLAGCVALGWRLGITECLIAVVTAGYSFDGIAHYANSAKHGVRGALTKVGRPIVYGAISTIGSSVVLLLAEILILKKLGLMVLFTMFLTILYAVVFLPAVLSLFGRFKMEQRQKLWLHSVAIRLINQRKKKMNDKRASLGSAYD